MVRGRREDRRACAGGCAARRGQDQPESPSEERFITHWLENIEAVVHFTQAMVGHQIPVCMGHLGKEVCAASETDSNLVEFERRFG